MSPQERNTRTAIDNINQLGWTTISHLCSNGLPQIGPAVSALSITIALAMLAGGATGTHRNELCAALGLNHPDEITEALSKTLAILKAPSIRFNAANALFTTRDTTAYPEYIAYLRKLDAHVDSTFTDLADGVDGINDWIAQETDGLITNMLTRDTLAHSHMVLINALVFKATWEKAFDPKHTIADYPFDSTKKVEMMFRHQDVVLVDERDTYTAVRLPYVSARDSNWAFVAYLPRKHKSIQEILPHIHPYTPTAFRKTKLSTLGLPKFHLRTQESLKPVLERLGYPLSSSFPVMGTGTNLVEQIIHSVAVILDEKGTEAAAATAVVMTRSRPANPLPSIVFDRPFAFAIVAEEAGVVVFSGVFSVA
ncbi:Serpin domain-containing protein [Aspergillus heterothallicus]